MKFPWIYRHNKPLLIDQSECGHSFNYGIKNNIFVILYWLDKSFASALTVHLPRVYMQKNRVVTNLRNRQPSNSIEVIG